MPRARVTGRQERYVDVERTNLRRKTEMPYIEGAEMSSNTNTMQADAPHILLPRTKQTAYQWAGWISAWAAVVFTGPSGHNAGQEAAGCDQGGLWWVEQAPCNCSGHTIMASQSCLPGTA